MRIDDLIDNAFEISQEYKSSELCESGGTGAALVTRKDNVYTGVAIDCACGIGFCAEHSAIAEMLKHKESEIAMIVAVTYDKQILPPCGRCRELIHQAHDSNVDTDVVIGVDKTIKLKDLLPHYWLDAVTHNKED